MTGEVSCHVKFCFASGMAASQNCIMCNACVCNV